MQLICVVVLTSNSMQNKFFSLPHHHFFIFNRMKIRFFIWISSSSNFELTFYECLYVHVYSFRIVFVLWRITFMSKVHVFNLDFNHSAWRDFLFDMPIDLVIQTVLSFQVNNGTATATQLLGNLNANFRNVLFKWIQHVNSVHANLFQLIVKLTQSLSSHTLRLPNQFNEI